MSNNPKQEVQKTSAKLRPIKLSDEKFELFYKEIYAEFGPKDVPPVEVHRQAKEVAPEPVEEVVPQVVAEEVVEEEAPQVVAEEVVEEEAPQVVAEEVVEEETPQVIAEEPVAEVAPRMVPAEPVEDLSEEFPMEPVCAPEEESAQAKAAAVICDVQEDEAIHEGVKPKKSRAVTALIVILCMEAVAIAGLAAYWLLQMG